MKTIQHFVALKRLILVGGVIGLIIFSYTSGQKVFMKELRLQSEQRIANDILLLQEDISDINRARALSTDIAVTDLGSLRLHAGAMYNHIHEEYDRQMASEYENSLKQDSQWM